MNIPTLKDFGWLPQLLQASQEKSGLILVTGAIGSGRTSLIAALLNEAGDRGISRVRILEREPTYGKEVASAPIDYWLLGKDFSSFPAGVHAAMEMEPGCIVIDDSGRVDHAAIVEASIMAAERGHLVFTTLHTIDCYQTFHRVAEMLRRTGITEPGQRLADVLRWVISLRLAPGVRGGRHALVEVIETRDPEVKAGIVDELKSVDCSAALYQALFWERRGFHWRSFDDACVEAYKLRIVDEPTAMLYCSRQDITFRRIRAIRKQRGSSGQSPLNPGLDHFHK